MITIQELLKDKPEALAHVEALIAKHDVWVVGGAARVLLYPFLPFPQDIDLLCNVERSIYAPITVQRLVDDSAACYGQQKADVGGVHFDVWERALTVWFQGVPCHGDGVAVRAKDSFVLMTRGFHISPWTETSLGYEGKPEYLDKHRVSLQRDVDAIAGAAAHDILSA